MSARRLPKKRQCACGAWADIYSFGGVRYERFPDGTFKLDEIDPELCPACWDLKHPEPPEEPYGGRLRGVL